MYTIKDSTLIRSTPAQIFQALTTNEGIRRWWTTDLDSDCETHEATFRFEPTAGQMHSSTFRMDSADERRIAMTCIRETNQSGWVGTTLTYTLVPDGDRTRVELVHDGYAAKDELYAKCTKGWAFFLGSLQRYLETGVGEPHVPVSKRAA